MCPQNLAANGQQNFEKRLHLAAKGWTRRAHEIGRFQQFATLAYPLLTRPRGLLSRGLQVQVLLGTLQATEIIREFRSPSRL